MDCRCSWYHVSRILLLRLAPVASYQVALVRIDARIVVGVEVGLQRVVGLDGVGARGGGALDWSGHAGRFLGRLE